MPYYALSALYLGKARHESSLIQIQILSVGIDSEAVNFSSNTHTSARTHTGPRGLVSFDLDLTQA